MRDVIEVLRQNLQPQGCSPIVRIGFFDGSPASAGYFNHDFIEKCLNTLEQRMLQANANLEPLNPLEQLASQLLFASTSMSIDEVVEATQRGEKSG